MWITTATIILLAVVAAAIFGIAYYRLMNPDLSVGEVVKNGKFKGETLSEGVYHAAVVGAGPSGSTLSHFAAKGGAKIALLEKKSFPRDKYCGDAVCTPAIRILEEMGVMQELIANNEANFADSGGFVSPSGLSFIGASKQKLGQAAACAVKRIHLDERIARSAARQGAVLTENFDVVDARFDVDEGFWTVTSAGGHTVKARVLVCADGAQSKLGMKLGYVTEAPRGVCSRAYVEGGTHNTNFDGVCFYQKESLPGYSAIFKHPNDELNYCYYLIPCDNKDGKGKASQGWCGDVTEADLPRLHNDAISKDPFISRALGPNAKVERMKAASLRLGSQGVKTSYDDHLLIIGDAAGHIDPLTGEGIHTAIMGGKVAARTLLDMIKEGDFSARSCKIWEERWEALFGHDFVLSSKAAALVYHYPILLDACAAEMQRKGDAMMSKWAEVMTGMQPKTYFLRPDIAIPLGIAVAREWVAQKFLGKKSVYYSH